jgi:hypothetical protein
LTIFGEKIGVYLKNQCYDQIFEKFSFVLSQKHQFFRRFFGENISQFITWPGHTGCKLKNVGRFLNQRCRGNTLVMTRQKVAKLNPAFLYTLGTVAMYKTRTGIRSLCQSKNMYIICILCIYIYIYVYYVHIYVYYVQEQAFAFYLSKNIC